MFSVCEEIPLADIAMNLRECVCGLIRVDMVGCELGLQKFIYSTKFTKNGFLGLR